MSNCDGVLLFHIREEWSLVIHLEIEDSMLIWQAEASCVDGGILGRGFWCKRKAMEG